MTVSCLFIYTQYQHDSCIFSPQILSSLHSAVDVEIRGEIVERGELRLWPRSLDLTPLFPFFSVLRFSSRPIIHGIIYYTLMPHLPPTCCKAARVAEQKLFKYNSIAVVSLLKTYRFGIVTLTLKDKLYKEVVENTQKSSCCCKCYDVASLCFWLWSDYIKRRHRLLPIRQQKFVTG